MSVNSNAFSSDPYAVGIQAILNPVAHTVGADVRYAPSLGNPAHSLDSLERRASEQPPPITFQRPSEIIGWNAPEGYNMVGDCHIARGNIIVIAGHAGVGKSRVTTALAVAGATQQCWMGLPVHVRFRTMIVQCENGPYRLQREYAETLGNRDLDDWIITSPPPPHGMDFGSPEFREAIKAEIREFEPGVIIIDPWNRSVEGDKQVEYRKAVDHIMECVRCMESDKQPAVVIIAHLRKPSAERRKGRDLLHELSGSLQLGSAARCVFALEAASSDLNDQTVVFTCCKSNDGAPGAPTAWIRANGLFLPAENFDLDGWLADRTASRRGVDLDAIRTHMRGGAPQSISAWARDLNAAGICGESTARNHLGVNGSLRGELTVDEGQVSLPPAPEGDLF